MSDQLDQLYRDVIMEHYKFPRGHKDIDQADMANQGQNPSCGDEIDVKLKLDNGIVKDVSVTCMGCAISVASGSMLAEIIEGKTLGEVKEIARIVKALLKGEETPEDIELSDLGDIEVLQGVRKFPVRIKCALLSWTTLVDAIDSYEEKDGTQIISTTEENKKHHNHEHNHSRE